MKRFFIRGIGLLELMLSLSIIAILLLLATRYYLTASYSQRLNQLSQQIAATQGAIYTWKGGRNNYTGLTDQVLVEQGLIAKADQNASGKIITPWSSPITVTTDSNDTKAKITFTAVSTDEKNACKNLEGSIKANAPADASVECVSDVFTYIFP